MKISAGRKLVSRLALGAFVACIGVKSARADEPDPKLKPTYGSVTLKSGFSPDPFSKTLTAGGRIATKLGGVTAHVARAPDFRLIYTAGANPLRIFVESKGDATLLVNLPNGSWVANDDGGVGVNPQLSFAKPPSGQYDIWVGTFAPKNVEAILKISELGATPRGAGIRVDVQVLTKRATLVNSPRLFHELEEEWNKNRGKIDKELEGLLGSLNPKLPRGVNFVRQKSAVGAAAITTSLGKATGLAPVKLMEIGVEIKGNSMRTRLTQPTVLGSDADPEFLVTYDLHGKIFIPVADNAKRLAVSRATFEVHNVKIDPRNTTARLAEFVNTMSKFVGGPDFKHKAEEMLSKKTDLAPKVNKLLEPINSKLATIPGEVTTTVQPGFVITLVPRGTSKKDDVIVK